MEGIGQLGIGPASVEESEKGALELGSSRNKDGKMVQLDSVNYRTTEDPEPMHVCKPLGQPPVEPECQGKGNKMAKSGYLHPGEPGRNELRRRYKCNF